MQKRHMQFLGALRLAQEILTVEAAALVAVNGSRARTRLDEVVARIESLATSSTSNRTASRAALSTEQQLARDYVRYHLGPIVRVARANVVDDPSLMAFRLPHRRSNKTRLLEVGRALMAAAEPHTGLFVEAGMPATFLDDARAAADRLAATMLSKGVHRTTASGSQKGLVEAIDQARRTVQVLNALVNATRELPESMLTQWRGAVRVVTGRTRAGREGQQTAPETQSATQPASQPVSQSVPQSPGALRAA